MEHELTVELTVTLGSTQLTSTPFSAYIFSNFYHKQENFQLNTMFFPNIGFALGSEVESQTKGIWAWVRPHRRHPDCCVVLLDTEGLGDVHKVRVYICLKRKMNTHRQSHKQKKIL